MVEPLQSDLSRRDPQEAGLEDDACLHALAAALGARAATPITTDGLRTYKDEVLRPQEIHVRPHERLGQDRVEQAEQIVAQVAAPSDCVAAPDDVSEASKGSFRISGSSKKISCLASSPCFPIRASADRKR